MQTFALHNAWCSPDIRYQQAARLMKVIVVYTYPRKDRYALQKPSMKGCSRTSPALCTQPNGISLFKLSMWWCSLSPSAQSQQVSVQVFPPFVPFYDSAANTRASSSPTSDYPNIRKDFLQSSSQRFVKTTLQLPQKPCRCR